MTWFDIDHEMLEKKFCTREPDLYKQLYKMNTEGQEMEKYQTLSLSVCNVKIK